jgi:hypothetical protein
MERLTEPEGARPGEGQGGAMVPIMRGLTERIAPALRRELEPHNVTVCTLDPSMTRSNPGDDYYTRLERVGFSPAIAHSVLVTARAITYIATCRNPSVFNGRFVVAEDLVRTFGLMTEADIYPDEFPALDSLPTLHEPPTV